MGSDPRTWNTTLAEDVYLMRYTAPAAWFGGPYMLEAAVIAELVMTGAVELNPRGRLIVRLTTTGTGDRILEDGLARLRCHPAAFRTDDGRFRRAGLDLVRALGAPSYPDNEEQIVAALVRKGLVERHSRRLLLVFPGTQVALADQDAADQRRSAVLDVAQAGRPSVRAANLAALAGLPTPGTVDVSVARALRIAAVQANTDAYIDFHLRN